MSDVVQEALAALAATGPLTSSRLVDVAADPAYILHDKFEWDDTKAGHEYRLIQARKIIASVVHSPAGASRPIPVYIHLPAPQGEGEYVPAVVLARQPARWQLARDEVLRYLDAAQDAVADLDEVLRVYGPHVRPIARATRAIQEARSEVEAITT